MISSSNRKGNAMNPQVEESPSNYEVILKLTVRDVALLWRAAAERLCSGGLEADDIDETIGSIDDPAINDCLATLALPMSVDGCALVDFHVHSGSWAKNRAVSDEKRQVPLSSDKLVWTEPCAVGGVTPRMSAAF